MVRSLNADARIIEADFGRAPLDQLLDTKLYSEEKAQTHPLWHKELYGFRDHVPETEEYGIRSFVYRARRPFHPLKLHELMAKRLPGVVRAKGHFWLATRPHWVGEYSLAGRITRTEAMGRWWATVPRERWPRSEEFQSLINKHWSPSWGDRRQEMVFIGGPEMDEAAIRVALDACLAGNPTTGLTQALLGLEDPFPRWERDAA